MPQFDLYGNYNIVLFFAICYLMYYASFSVLILSVLKLVYTNECIFDHVFLCNSCKKLQIFSSNVFYNFIFNNQII